MRREEHSQGRGKTKHDPSNQAMGPDESAPAAFPPAPRPALPTMGNGITYVAPDLGNFPRSIERLSVTAFADTHNSIKDLSGHPATVAALRPLAASLHAHYTYRANKNLIIYSRHLSSSHVMGRLGGSLSQSLPLISCDRTIGCDRSEGVAEERDLAPGSGADLADEEVNGVVSEGVRHRKVVRKVHSWHLQGSPHPQAPAQARRRERQLHHDRPRILDPILSPAHSQNETSSGGGAVNNRVENERPRGAEKGEEEEEIRRVIFLPSFESLGSYLESAQQRA